MSIETIVVLAIVAVIMLGWFASCIRDMCRRIDELEGITKIPFGTRHHGYLGITYQSKAPINKVIQALVDHHGVELEYEPGTDERIVANRRSAKSK